MKKLSALILLNIILTLGSCSNSVEDSKVQTKSFTNKKLIAPPFQ